MSGVTVADIAPGTARRAGRSAIGAGSCAKATRWCPGAWQPCRCSRNRWPMPVRPRPRRRPGPVSRSLPATSWSVPAPVPPRASRRERSGRHGLRHRDVGSWRAGEGLRGDAAGASPSGPNRWRHDGSIRKGIDGLALAVQEMSGMGPCLAARLSSSGLNARTGSGCRSGSRPAWCRPASAWRGKARPAQAGAGSCACPARGSRRCSRDEAGRETVRWTVSPLMTGGRLAGKCPERPVLPA